jgi:hypothetical protein
MLSSVLLRVIREDSVKCIVANVLVVKLEQQVMMSRDSSNASKAALSSSIDQNIVIELR